MEQRTTRKTARCAGRRQQNGAGGTRRVAAWLVAKSSSARLAIARFAARAAAWLRQALRRRRVPVEVLVVESRRRRRIERAIRAALRQLNRGSASAPTVTAIVVSEHVVASAKELAGATHVCSCAGGHAALIRLALSAGGRDLSDDEVLGVLADQWIGLATQQSGPSVLVPVELPAKPPAPQAGRPRAVSTVPAAARRGDPLAPLGPAGTTEAADSTSHAATGAGNTHLAAFGPSSRAA